MPSLPSTPTKCLKPRSRICPQERKKNCNIDPGTWSVRTSVSSQRAFSISINKVVEIAKKVTTWTWIPYLSVFIFNNYSTTEHTRHMRNSQMSCCLLTSQFLPEKHVLLFVIFFALIIKGLTSSDTHSHNMSQDFKILAILLTSFATHPVPQATSRTKASSRLP